MHYSRIEHSVHMQPTGLLYLSNMQRSVLTRASRQDQDPVTDREDGSAEQLHQQHQHQLHQLHQLRRTSTSTNTPQSHDTMPPAKKIDKITLFCLIHGQKTTSAFSVQIDSLQTFSVLKEEIVKKNRAHFKGTDPRQLRLWHVSITVGDERHPNTGRFNELNPTWKIGKAFPTEPPEEQIHIYIEALGPKAECTSCIMTTRFLLR